MTKKADAKSLSDKQQQETAKKIMGITNELIEDLKGRDLTVAEAGVVIESLRRMHESVVGKVLYENKLK